MQRKKQRDTDGRGLSHDKLTELRIRGIKAVQSGQHPNAVAAALGVARQTIYNWLSIYRGGGWGALDADKRGGRTRKLDAEAMRLIATTVLTEDPRQMSFPFALWTLPTIAEMILRKFGVSLSRWAVSKLLKQLGMSPQRPLWRAWQQDPKAVEAWLKHEYPAIKRQARKAGAEIYFGDEAGIRSDHHAGTTWGFRGLTPIIKCTGARFGINMISAVSPSGKLRFMIVQGSVNAKVFIEFLRRLTQGASKPVYLIVDGHPAHKAKVVREYLAANADRIKLFTLPSYSPELNPDELVWNHVKNHAVGKTTASSKLDLKRLVKSALAALQRCPEKIRAFFQHAETCYAA
jgi:transposase